MPPLLNYSVTNSPQMSSVRQHSSRFSQNRMPESKSSSIPGRISADTLNTMPPPSTKHGSRNIYGYMVDVSKLKPAQRQHHAVTLLQHYHELCNTNDPSSIFVSPPLIPNIESFSQSNISSLYSGQFGRNRSGVNIQQPRSTCNL